MGAQSSVKQSSVNRQRGGSKEFGSLLQGKPSMFKRRKMNWNFYSIPRPSWMEIMTKFWKVYLNFLTKHWIISDNFSEEWKWQKSLFHFVIFYTLMASLTVPAVPGKAAEYLMMVQCSPNIVWLVPVLLTSLSRPEGSSDGQYSGRPGI